MTTEISTNTTPARGLALATMGEAMQFAQMVAKSDFAPKDFKGKPESCLLAIQHGSEVGLSPMQSLQSIAVINGRPTVWGDAAMALVRASYHCEYVVEVVEGDGDQMVARCTAKRRGYPQAAEVTFSVADAKKAGLWGKSGPWTQYPRRMLQLRARGFALRDAFPDVLKGLVTAEEAQDYPTQPEPVVVRPKFSDEPKPATVVRMKSEPASVPEDTAGKARLAVSRATTFEMLHAIRTLVDKRHAEKAISDAEKAELVDLIHHKAEMLIGEDKGQEFTHEAAEHEVQE